MGRLSICFLNQSKPDQTQLSADDTVLVDAQTWPELL